MKNNLLAISLIVAGVASRLLPHLPNFTMIGAIALVAPLILPKKYAFSIPLVTMFISDLWLGSHPTIGWVYGSILFISIAAWWLKNKVSGVDRIILPTGSALSFFIITNFGVWVTTDMYAKTLSGLLECYTLAIPFFKYTLAGDVFYSVLLLGGLTLYKQVEKNRLLTQLQPSHSPTV